MSDMTKETKNPAFAKATAGKEKLEERAPVVVVLGHVDHGKSSLLEAIREDFVITAKEAGGITQHIGAYEVEKNNKKITFIDTPGHEAFSAMRQRGAKVADIAVLVVDAVEGVRPQTKEAIKFIKKAGIPMLVAFNKIDKPGADPEKVKQQISKEEVIVESYGGKIPSCNVSAKTKQGIKELLETILLIAELEELKSDTLALPEGTIIESAMDQQKGPVATLILEKGILQKGDVLATDSSFGKIKQMNDFEGKPLETVLPSQPVSVLGFETPPGVGEKFKKYNSIEQAQSALEKKEKRIPGRLVLTEQDKKILNIILKTDVLGSGEAIEGILKNLPQEKVILRLLKSEVGDVALTDIQLAESGRGKIFGFRVKIDENTKVFAKQKAIKVKMFDVIYELVQEARREMLSVVEPELKRLDLGKFKVSHLFKQNKNEQIVGGKVIEGEITQNTLVEILRDKEIIGKGRIKGLEQEKKSVGKVEKGKEAGISFVGDAVIEENDILQVFREEKEKGTL